MTNLPTTLTDFISFENAQGTAIGAKNADGSVYVLTMDQLDVDGVSGISASSEFFYLVLSSGAQINDLNSDGQKIIENFENYSFKVRDEFIREFILVTFSSKLNGTRF